MIDPLAAALGMVRHRLGPEDKVDDALVVYDAQQRRNDQLTQVVALNQRALAIAQQRYEGERSIISTCSMSRSNCSKHRAIWSEARRAPMRIRSPYARRSEAGGRRRTPSYSAPKPARE